MAFRSNHGFAQGGGGAPAGRVDAIGGSSAGVYVNNQVRVASLFRGVPTNLFNSRVRDLFSELKVAWGNIPFEVVNDGEVTALAGSMALGKNAVLGVAMGSSQAGGVVTPEGGITTWLNELAFVPVDYAVGAPVDEWSGNRGCGVQYFSQQAVGRLMPIAGIEAPAGEPLPEKLKRVQSHMEQGDPRAAKIYETIGGTSRDMRWRTTPSFTTASTFWFWVVSRRGLGEKSFFTGRRKSCVE